MNETPSRSHTGENRPRYSDSGPDERHGNRLLNLLSPRARSYLDTHQILRPMTTGETLYEENAPFTHAIFPHAGVVSLMAEMEDGRAVEKASIGNEGYVGFALMLGGGVAISRSVVRIGGAASWLPLASLDHALAEFPCVHDVLMRYGKSLVGQLMQSVACNSLHTSDQRIIRWLLHAHDRMGEDRFHITQESLSQVLGLRRATVGATCTALMNAGIIEYARGDISIRDRAQLEARCCECYGRITRTYDWQKGDGWSRIPI
ncbi:MAG TPA: Crp/Fnr family transcriptional regulator [Saliniramus sp.]|nr:Crp/Fnr family transcriptional regulator [Saliniramus sp.]